MTTEQIKNVLELHRKWILNDPAGQLANFRGADLQDADLRGADLQDADLQGADLSRANLQGANFQGANLRGADLHRADLRDADFQGADLQRANLQSTNLLDAKLDRIHEDVRRVLSIAKAEASGLFDALMRGRIDGTVYSGECACLVGTIANIRREDPEWLGIDLQPDSDRPAERWFLGIHRGDTPENNPIAAITAYWIKEFMTKEGLPVPEYRLVSSLEHPEIFNRKEHRS